MAVPSLIMQAHPPYYDQTNKGQVFAVTTAAAGLALPINTSTTGAFALWNPLGSGVNVVPIEYNIEYVSGTGVLGSFGFMSLTPAGAQIATASPILTGTAISTATNQFIGGAGAQAKQSIVLSAFTLTAVGVHLRGIGVGQQVVVPAGTSFVGPLVYQFNGTCVMAPGSMIYSAAFAATVSVFYQTIIWAEIPV